ncbi:MAG: NfeD family protein [Clostridia bacterium]|nr:NfeD family protein [Clostridia bacterium]
MEYAMLIFWIVLLVVLVIVEAVTAQLVTIWFAAGAAAALISELCGLQEWLQWVIFIAVSAVALIATRPLVKKATKKTIQPTNADRCIGQTAVVTEEINNIEGKGQVHVNGVIWTARSSDGSVFRKDERVTVDSIEGVKLIVKAQN